MFVEGPVTPEFIANSIGKHASNTTIGAHQLFLGQIRKDRKEDREVVAIEFTAYREMADDAYNEFREVLFGKYNLVCMHVYHSLGRIQAGEINLFVFVSSTHRKDAMAACSELVEWIKKDLPVWGKEILTGDAHAWKINS